MKETIVTMGTFDGVHRGHQAVVLSAVRLARERKARSVALTFARPPRLYFSPQEGQTLLTMPDEKAELLKKLGVDEVEMLEFDGTLARVPARQFFQDYFVRRYRAREIVVGYNFGFGRGREGDVKFLKEQGSSYNISTQVIEPVSLNGAPVSSGQVREHLRRGNLEEANNELGYHYFLSGKVVKGRGVGRRLGFPTANLVPPSEKFAPPGVFAVRVVLPGGAFRRGMCNVGFRPTVEPRSTTLAVEVHIFGFRENLSRRTLRVEFVRKIRIEKKFPSLPALQRQLKQDASLARRWLK